MKKIISLLFGEKPKNNTSIKPCGIKTTIIPRSFTEQFKIWDEHVCGKEIIYID